jgi:hypothetical protein
MQKKYFISLLGLFFVIVLSFSFKEKKLDNYSKKKLGELLFNEKVESYNIPLHNALVDTLVCLRCGLKLFHGIYVSSEEFTESIESLIPTGISSI